MNDYWVLTGRRARETFEDAGTADEPSTGDGCSGSLPTATGQFLASTLKLYIALSFKFDYLSFFEFR